VENLILYEGFWKNILNCVRGSLPLIKVWHMVDSYEKQPCDLFMKKWILLKRCYKVFLVELVKSNNN